MLKCVSKQVKESLANNGNLHKVGSLESLREQNRRKYTQTLNFMREWSRDLLERQNELHNQRQNYCQMALKDGESSNSSVKPFIIDVQHLINTQFVKKVESLYIKQLSLNTSTNRGFNRQELRQQQQQEDSLDYEEGRSSSKTFKSNSKNENIFGSRDSVEHYQESDNFNDF